MVELAVVKAAEERVIPRSRRLARVFTSRWIFLSTTRRPSPRLLETTRHWQASFTWLHLPAHTSALRRRTRKICPAAVPGLGWCTRRPTCASTSEWEIHSVHCGAYLSDIWNCRNYSSHFNNGDNSWRLCPSCVHEPFRCLQTGHQGS